jgi:uncharacterized repeat protein (TIGR03803 family)
VNCTDGREPHGSVVIDGNSVFFGTTQYGGANDKGIVYALSP